MNYKDDTVILMIEDDESLLTTNKRVLSRALGNKIRFDNVRTLKEARETLLKKETAYDMILLDIMLSDGSGVEFIPEIHAVTDAPTLILSVKNTPLETIKGIERGGDYYITIPYEPEVMAALVHGILQRERKERTTAPVINIVRGNLTLDLIAKRAYIRGIDAGLEGKEFPLLSLLVREEGNTISADRLNAIIWKSDIENDKHSVKKQVFALSAKLESGECNYKIISVLNEGYRFEEI